MRLDGKVVVVTGAAQGLGRACAECMADEGAKVVVSDVNAEGGVNQLTKGMAPALADKRIRVNAIGPGSIITDMLRSVAHDKDAMHKILACTQLGRAGEPEEIGKFAVFLASEDSSYMTGEIVYADGGRLALNYTVPVKE